MIVADPSLVDARGHHFALTEEISRGALSEGLDVLWLTHKDFERRPSAGDGNVQVHRVFSNTMYDRYRPERDGLPAQPHRVLLGDFKQGLKRCGAHAEDHVLFHTAYGDVYRALREVLAGEDWREWPFVHVCTPYDLATMPGRDPQAEMLELFHGMRLLMAVDKKIFFWAETPQLALHYTLTYGFNVRGLPLPCPVSLYGGGQMSDDATTTVVYLGPAREEKGFLLLPEVVERLYGTHGRIGKLRFVVQCTPQIIGYLPSIRAAIDKLRTYPSSYVRLIDQTLDEAEYHGLLRGADVVWLLYDRNNYRIRGSGVAVEAVCAGKCILARRETFCASLVTHGGGWQIDSVEEAVDALSDMAENRTIFRQRGTQQAREYSTRNRPDRYVRKLLSVCETRHRVPFLPSAITGRVRPSLLRI